MCGILAEDSAYVLEKSRAAVSRHDRPVILNQTVSHLRGMDSHHRVNRHGGQRVRHPDLVNRVGTMTLGIDRCASQQPHSFTGDPEALRLFGFLLAQQIEEGVLGDDVDFPNFDTEVEVGLSIVGRRLVQPVEGTELFSGRSQNSRTDSITVLKRSVRDSSVWARCRWESEL